MSVLETSRFHFKGQVTWDPIVTNNDPGHYDETTAKPVLSTAADKVAAFRARAIGDVARGGNWNPHGTHRATFCGCAVTSYDVGAGVEVADPFVGAAVRLTGMLVDLEPYGTFSSQIFFDRATFGVEGGYFLGAARRRRITARYVNFARNPSNAMIAGVASVIWQTSFEKGPGLSFLPQDSAVLRVLDDALADDGVKGLTLRFNAYRTVYFDDPSLRNRSAPVAAAASALGAKLLSGGFQPNPARSLLVGVVGLWRDGEAASEPSERTLRPVPGSPVATAFAHVGAGRLTLDLANSIPEANTVLDKADLGTLTIASIDPQGRDVAVLGTVPRAGYDRASYESSAGMTTIPLNADAEAAARGNDLVLRDGAGNVLAREAALRVIPEKPNLYRDEGHAASARFQVYARGAPLRSGSSVDVFAINADGSPAGRTQTLRSDAAGVLEVPVPATGGDVMALVPSAERADATPATTGIDPQVTTYMYVRTLPADADVAALPPTWDNVFSRVLANWAAIAPCMDNWLPLDDESQVRASTSLLNRLTDPARFGEYRFMPVTRDMTAGQRALLQNFLDSAPAAEVALAPAAPPNFAELSRAMRRGPIAG